MIDHYELLYIIAGTKTDEEVKPMVENIQNLVKQRGGTITKTDFWGKRKLAYEIDHIRQGFYDLVEFDADTQSIAALDNDLRLNDTILRHQLIRRVVKSAEAIAKTEALQQRIATKRQAEKERQQTATIVAGQEPVKVEPIDTKPVAPEELKQKLEEILESDKIDV